MKKNINTKKRELLNRIRDLKVNMNAVTEINRSLVKEKKQVMGSDFHKKNIKERKQEIVAMIHREEAMMSSIAMTPLNQIKMGKSKSDEGVKNRIRAAIGSSGKAASFKNSSEKAIFDKVTHDLLNDDIEIRSIAAAELGETANKASIPVLKEALGYGNIQLSSEIINAMININDAFCLPVFKKNITDHNYRIRLGCLRGIYKLNDKDSVPDLINGLKDKHVEVRKSSATFLGWVGVKNTIPPLIQVLKDPNQEVIKAAAMSLAILKDPSSVMPLISALGGSSIDAREQIVHAMEKITGKSVEFEIDASGNALNNNIERLKSWWRKDQMAVEEGGAEQATPEEKRQRRRQKKNLKKKALRQKV